MVGELGIRGTIPSAKLHDSSRHFGILDSIYSDDAQLTFDANSDMGSSSTSLVIN